MKYKNRIRTYVHPPLPNCHKKHDLPGEPFFLAHAPMDGDGGEVLLDEQLRQRDASLHRLHENHHLEMAKSNLIIVQCEQIHNYYIYLYRM